MKRSNTPHSMLFASWWQKASYGGTMHEYHRTQKGLNQLTLNAMMM